MVSGVIGPNNTSGTHCIWAWQHSRYNDWLRAGRSGDRIPVGARFSAPVQTGPGARPASCTMGTGSFPEVKSGRGMTLTPRPLLVPWSWKGRAIPLFPLWAVRPVQSLSVCTGVHFTFTFTTYSTPHSNLTYVIALRRLTWELLFWEFTYLLNWNQV